LPRNIEKIPNLSEKTFGTFFLSTRLEHTQIFSGLSGLGNSTAECIFGSLGIAVINPFWYTDLTENTEKERIFKGFSVSSVSSVYKNHGNSQRTVSSQELGEGNAPSRHLRRAPMR
jgi:hypothetical protein